MYRSRQKRLPPLPKTRTEINLTGDWVNTLSGERFLLRNEGSSDRILIFSTNAMLHLFCDLEVLHIDGTFQVCPSMFMQFSPSMDLSMASSFLWFMPYYHPRPERITTGCLLTSRKSYRIEACRWVHRVWWLISSSNLSRCSCQALRFKDATSISCSVYGGSRDGWSVQNWCGHQELYP